MRTSSSTSVRPVVRAHDRRRGNAVVGVVVLLLLLALALGGNYVRNYQTDQEQQDPQTRPYAKYGVEDLKVLAEGYRQELARLESGHGGGRVEVRNRHHFTDQVREFERVQQAARRSRDKAVEIAQTRGQLKQIEEEIGRREQAGAGMQVHLERMFRI